MLFNERKSMNLGDHAQISISVKSVEDSYKFYSKFGYELSDKNSLPEPWMLLAGGGMNLLLYQTVFASPSIVYFAADMDERVDAFKKTGLKYYSESDHLVEQVKGVFFDPDGLGISLTKHQLEKKHQAHDVEGFKFGRFGEISIPVKNLSNSIDFWSRLGFKKIYQSESPYPSASLSDGLLTLGLHQQGNFEASYHYNFKTPAITFFSLDSAEKIESLKREGFQFMKEMKNKAGIVSDVVLTDPDGQLIFFYYG